jgi:hypothetical protein
LDAKTVRSDAPDAWNKSVDQPWIIVSLDCTHRHTSSDSRDLILFHGNTTSWRLRNPHSAGQQTV